MGLEDAVALSDPSVERITGYCAEAPRGKVLAHAQVLVSGESRRASTLSAECAVTTLSPRIEV